MASGFFVQGVALLFSQAPLDPDVARALAPLGATPFTGPARNLHTTSWLLPFRPDAHGALIVDVMPRPWPDPMGSDQSDQVTFLDWGVGGFGPGAWPGGLLRAAQGSPEPEALTVIAQHRGVVRVRLSYALLAPDGAPLEPSDRDPLAEVTAVLRVARALLALPGALAFYNPNAELIVTPPAHERIVSLHQNQRLPWPLLLAVRNLPIQQPPDHLLLDTLGVAAQFSTLGQRLRDHEIVLDGARFSPAEAGHVLRGLCATAISRGSDWQAGDEIEGPGGLPWTSTERAEALLVPPRPVLRWSPAREVGARAPG